MAGRDVVDDQRQLQQLLNLSDVVAESSNDIGIGFQLLQGLARQDQRFGNGFGHPPAVGYFGDDGDCALGPNGKPGALGIKCAPSNEGGSFMTTVTLEVPDELAVRLSSLSGRLPELLSRLLDSQPANGASSAFVAGAGDPAYNELIDFLASNPTQEQILAFQISPAAQERLAGLLERNREEGLSAEESTELDLYQLIHNAVVLLKARVCASAA
jgi:hypothetical protein